MDSARPLLQLTGWQVVLLHSITLICFTAAVIAPLLVVRKDPKLIDVAARVVPLYLRAIAVVLVIWATSGLAMLGRLDQPSSVMFGAILGYVFGTIRPVSLGP